MFLKVFGLEKCKVTNSRYNSYMMGSNHKLQVLQNKFNRMLTGAKYNKPTADILIQQIIGFQTIMMSTRITKSNNHYRRDFEKDREEKDYREDRDYYSSQIYH